MAPTSPVMQPTSPSVCSSRKDRLSINIAPDQPVGTEPILSCLPCLFGEDAECCYFSRLVDADSSQGQQSCTSLTKVETAIMNEVADWWQSQYVDEFWAPRNKQQRRVRGLASSRTETNLNDYRYRLLPTRSCYKPEPRKSYRTNYQPALIPLKFYSMRLRFNYLPLATPVFLRPPVIYRSSNREPALCQSQLYVYTRGIGSSLQLVTTLGHLQRRLHGPACTPDLHLRTISQRRSHCGSGNDIAD